MLHIVELDLGFTSKSPIPLAVPGHARGTGWKHMRTNPGVSTHGGEKQIIPGNPNDRKHMVVASSGTPLHSQQMAGEFHPFISAWDWRTSRYNCWYNYRRSPGVLCFTFLSVWKVRSNLYVPGTLKVEPVMFLRQWAAARCVLASLNLSKRAREQRRAACSVRLRERDISQSAAALFVVL